MSEGMGVQAESAESKERHELLEGGALALGLARAAEDLKGEDLRVVDVRGLTDVMDFMVLASAGSTRHLRALDDSVRDAVLVAGRRTIGEPGEADTGWMVVDTGDVVCHLMTRELRLYYDLDGLWGDARVVEFAGEADA